MNSEAEDTMPDPSTTPAVALEPTAENFAVEVIERSHAVPVVVDFWAEWCQPCRVLGPVLEKLAAEYQGKFVLAKVETEKHPEIASSFGVRSIPAVFAIRGGQVVDSFVGILPEPALRAWLERIMPTEADRLISEAKALEATEPEASRAKYAEAATLAPADPAAMIGLGRALLALGRDDEAREVVGQLERRGFLEPEAETVKARLILKGPTEVGEDLDTLLQAHRAGPRDNARQLRLAEALATAGRSDESLALALDLVEMDRRGKGEPARKLMLAVFQLLPADSPLVTDYRRRLSVVL